MSPPLVLIGGPTASGKSALALAVAEAFGGTVINADSMQVYRDLEILTARPGPAEMARVPHRLFGVLDAADPCSAAHWREMALKAIEEAAADGRLPILAGGTGLYFHVLTHGIAAVPRVAPEVRQEATALHSRLGGAAFRAALAQHDPEGARRLSAGDTQRLIRAYEVVTATGRPLAEWHRQPVSGWAGPVLQVAVLPPRAALYAACDSRLRRMVETGAIEEVRRVVARRLDPALPAMKALGVPELARHLAGECGIEEAIAAAQQATRRYAKRQYTWFRNRWPAATRIDTQFLQSLLPEIFSLIRRFLLTAESLGG